METLAGPSGIKKKKKKLHTRNLDGTVPRAIAENDGKRAELVAEARKGLPESGHYRREIEKLRHDQLQERIQQISREIEAGASAGSIVDKLGIDRDIVQHFDPNGGFKITNAKPGKVYAWISYDYPRDAKGAAVRRQLTKRGWEIVNEFTCTSECKRTQVATCEHNMPEAPDLRQPDGTRKLGDTLLLRCDQVIFVATCAIALAARKMKLKQSAARLPKSPFRTHEDPRDPVVRETFRRLGVSNEGQEETLLEGTTGGRLPSE